MTTLENNELDNKQESRIFDIKQTTSVDQFVENYLSKQKVEEDMLSETGTYTIEKSSDFDQMNNNKSSNIELRQMTINQLFGVDKNNIEIQPFSSTLSTSASMNSSVTSTGSSITEQKPRNTHRNIKYTSGRNKRLTYDVIKDGGDVNNNTDYHFDDNASNCTTAMTVNTNLLLGDTDELMNRIKKKQEEEVFEENEGLSTRAMVNGGQLLSTINSTNDEAVADEEEDDRSLFNTDLNRSNNGSYSFNIDLYQPSGKKPNKSPGIYDRSYKPQTSLLTNTSMATSLTEHTDYTDRTQKTLKSEMSLGAKIQQKASNEKFASRNLVSSRSSPITDRTTTSSISSTLSSNRTLDLRQKSAKEKRDLLNKLQQSAYPQSAQNNLSSSKLQKKPQLINQPLAHNQQQSILNTTNSNHAAAKDSLLRRKMYDPNKSVEGDKIKRQIERNKMQDLEQSLSSSNTDLNSQFKNIQEKQFSLSKSNSKNLSKSSLNLSKTSFSSIPKSKTKQITPDKSKDQNESLKPALKKSNSISATSASSFASKTYTSRISDENTEDDNDEASYVSLPSQTQKIASKPNNSPANAYDNLLLPTIQRICIRLIKTSTSILGKIGDNNGKSLITGSNDERTESLIKIVHSMSIITDQMTTIDSLLLDNQNIKTETLKNFI